MFRRLNEVKQVQIGITTNCNSNCRFCFRVELERQGIYPTRDKRPLHLSFEKFKNIFKDTNLTDVQFCGNKGDAIFHPEFHKILDYTIDQDVFISLATNGSVFSEKWWRELGKRMKGEVTFTLDGVDEDTHAMYRGTSFVRVLKHMNAFIQGGGRARWQFIVFKHNEHQIEEAKKLSKKMGCQQFITVISRFYDDICERPSTNELTKREMHLSIEKQKVYCQWISMKRIYVSTRGYAYPCCFLRCNTHGWYTMPKYIWIKDGIERPEYNIANNTLNNIIKLPTFTQIYDEVNDIGICNLHCTNIEYYENKIRKEERI